MEPRFHRDPRDFRQALFVTGLMQNRWTDPKPNNSESEEQTPLQSNVF